MTCQVRDFCVCSVLCVMYRLNKPCHQCTTPDLGASKPGISPRNKRQKHQRASVMLTARDQKVPTDRIKTIPTVFSVLLHQPFACYINRYCFSVLSLCLKLFFLLVLSLSCFLVVNLCFGLFPPLAGLCQSHLILKFYLNASEQSPHFIILQKAFVSSSTSGFNETNVFS